jgi:CubicO group peptidase (beta-lactamase class C family)
MKQQKLIRLAFLGLLGQLSLAGQSFGTPISGSVVTPNPGSSTSTPSVDLLFQIESANRYNEFENDIANGETLAQRMSHHGVVGTAVIIIEKNKITQKKFYGFRDVPKSKPVDGNTIFHAASMSKFIAGITFARANQLGDIKLTKNLRKYADEKPGGIIDQWVDRAFIGATASYPDSINLKRLLGHVGGLDKHGIGTSLSGITVYDALYGSFNNYAMGVIPETRPIHAPTEFYDYSGGGFIAAEQVLVEATGETFKDYASREILEQFNLTKSTFAEASKTMVNLARPCLLDIPGISPCNIYKTYVKSAGGFLANPEEYAKILTLFMNEGKDEQGTQVLELQAMQDVMTPVHQIESSLNYCRRDSDCPTEEECFLNACYLYPKQYDSSSVILTPIYQNIGGRNIIVGYNRDYSNVGRKYYGLGVTLSGSTLSDGLPKTLDHGGHDPNMGAAQEMRINRETQTGIVVMTTGDTSIDDERGGLKFADEVIDAYKAVYEE